uniref:Group XIIA secretory phospholipase A2 n=1 Tax=Otus sunia TaxID=257818 RepID=A0A8C8AX76_9STRI
EYALFKYVFSSPLLLIAASVCFQYQNKVEGHFFKLTPQPSLTWNAEFPVLLCDKLPFSGSKPFPRYGYKPSPPNGCGSPLFGVQFDIGIPSMTKCCNHHDRCYDTCGNKKNDCDEQFQSCLSKICRDVQKTLGISESVQACESTVQLLFDAVIHLGCKPYLDSQRAACMCHYEDKTDL